MKIKNIILIGLAIVNITVFFTACKGENVDSGDPYLNFDDVSGVINVSQKGFSQSKRKTVYVRSNSSWKVALENIADTAWLHFYIDEGVDDGHIEYWVDPNNTFKEREGKISFTVGNKVVNSIDILQAPSVPSITAKPTDFTVVPEGAQIALEVTANIDWSPSLSTDASWAHITRVTNDSVFLTIDPNEEDERTAVLTMSGTGKQANVMAKVNITQKDQSLIFSDDFSWLKEGKVDYYYNFPEQKYSVWTDKEKAAGWTTFDEGTLFGGQGYIKFGKTNYFGDTESPKLFKLKKATDVTVSFQAIGYLSKSGTKDASTIKVAVLGPGEIDGSDISSVEVKGTQYRCVRFVTTVFPNSSNNEHGEGYDPWADSDSHFSFTITGATGETQLMFVGGEQWGSGKGKNRVLVDNVTVVRTKR